MAETLEQKVDAEKQEKKEEKKQSEFEQAGRGLINSVLGAGAVGAATKFFGLDGLVTAASFPVGGFIESKLAGKEFTSRNFRDEAIAGGLFAPALWYTVKTIQNVPKAYGLDSMVNVLGASMPASTLAIGGLTLAAIPLLNAVYYPIKYLVDNRTFRGIGKDFKENYWKGTKRSMLYLGLPTAVAVAASSTIPFLAPYLFPILAGLEVAYRLVLSKEKLNYLKLLNPATYLPNFLNPFYMAKGAASAASRIIKGTATAVYDIGSGISDLYKKPPQQAPAAQPAT